MNRTQDGEFDLNHNQAYRIRSQPVSASDNRIAIDILVEPISGTETSTNTEDYAFSLSDYRVRASRSKGTMQGLFDQIVSYDTDGSSPAITTDATVNSNFNIFNRPDIEKINSTTAKLSKCIFNSSGMTRNCWYSIFQFAASTYSYCSGILSIVRGYTNGKPLTCAYLINGSMTSNPVLDMIGKSADFTDISQTEQITAIRIRAYNSATYLDVYLEGNNTTSANNYDITFNMMDNVANNFNDTAGINPLTPTVVTSAIESSSTIIATSHILVTGPMHEHIYTISASTTFASGIKDNAVNRAADAAETYINGKADKTIEIKIFTDPTGGNTFGGFYYRHGPNYWSLILISYATNMPFPVFFKKAGNYKYSTLITENDDD